MAKKLNIIGANISKKIVGAKPVGNLVLVEILTKQETLNTRIFVGEDSDKESPQAYIVEIGPLVNPQYGFKPGDRVMLSGIFVPVPKFNDTGRQMGMTGPDTIKGVLVEEE